MPLRQPFSTTGKLDWTLTEERERELGTGRQIKNGLKTVERQK
jgi:hypothetical protein